MSFSADGQTLAFSSYANNLVPGDTNNVQDIFITTLGAPIDQSIYVSLVSVADLNGNGSPELAVARTLTDGRAEVLIRDSATKQALGTVDFIESGLPLVDLAAVGDVSGEGYPELAALFRKPDGPAVVQLKDAAAGSEIGRLRFFGKDWDVTAVTGIDRGSDGPEIAVLGVRKDTLQAGIELRPGRGRWNRGPDAVPGGCGPRVSRPRGARGQQRRRPARAGQLVYARRRDGQGRHQGRRDQRQDQHARFSGYRVARCRRERYRRCRDRGSVR